MAVAVVSDISGDELFRIDRRARRHHKQTLLEKCAVIVKG